MNSIAAFPQNLKKAVSSPAFYKEVPNGKFGPAIKYFLILTVLLAIVKSILVSLTIVPGVETLISKLRENIVNLYPAELTVTITNGQLSTNAKEPLIIPLSSLDKILPQAKSDINQPAEENLLVIDTKASPSDFPKLKTAVLLTRDGLVIADRESGGYRYTPIPSETNLTIDRRFVRSLWSQFSPYINYVIPGLITLIFLSLILWIPNWNLSYLIFSALLIKLSSKIVKNNPLSYRTAFKIGLYSITVPLLAEFIFGLFNFSLPPLTFTLIFLFFTLYILRPTAPLPK
jgi:hypothetical protein